MDRSTAGLDPQPNCAAIGDATACARYRWTALGTGTFVDGTTSHPEVFGLRREGVSFEDAEAKLAQMAQDYSKGTMPSTACDQAWKPRDAPGSRAADSRGHGGLTGPLRCPSKTPYILSI